MRRHRRHSTVFKRQVVEESLAGAALNALSKARRIDAELRHRWFVANSKKVRRIMA